MKKDENKEEKRTSELDNLISNLNEGNNDNNKKTLYKNRIYLPNDQK